MNIFRAYDIRGTYPEQISPDLGRKVGFAFGQMVKEKAAKSGFSEKSGKIKIAVGADARLGAREVKKAAIEGLVSSGVHVVDIGHVPTPLVYFAVVTMGLDAGIQVTGSHNPKEYLGFKFCGRGAEPLGYDDGIDEIEAFCNSKREILPMQEGSSEEKDIKEDYVDFVSKRIKLERPFHVVVDAGNGVAGDVSRRLFEKLGCSVDCIYCEPDGNFPNHIANPSNTETLRSLQGRVREAGADLGIAFDGDGDRVGFVDRKGKVIPNDMVFSLFIEKTLKERPGAKVAYDLLCSRLVEDVIKRNGGVSLVSKVGYPFLRKMMKENGAVLGGESSLHVYFSENFSYDDGMFAAVKFLESLHSTDLEDFCKGLPKYITSKNTSIFCRDDDKFSVMDTIKDSFKKQGIEFSGIDGVKVFFRDGWGAIRPSNTQPALVMRWEASNEKAFREIEDFLRSEVLKVMKNYGIATSEGVDKHAG